MLIIGNLNLLVLLNLVLSSLRSLAVRFFGLVETSVEASSFPGSLFFASLGRWNQPTTKGSREESPWELGWRRNRGDCVRVEVFQLSLSQASRGFGVCYRGFPSALSLLENRQATQATPSGPSPRRFSKWRIEHRRGEGPGDEVGFYFKRHLKKNIGLGQLFHCELL